MRIIIRWLTYPSAEDRIVHSWQAALTIISRSGKRFDHVSIVKGSYAVTAFVIFE